MKKINWKKGNAAIMLGTMFAMLAIVLIILITESANVCWGRTVAETRTDAIADGAAVYAQSSMDMMLNKPQAQIMAAMLTTANDTDMDGYKLFTTVRFDDVDTMVVKGTVTANYMYPVYQDTEEYLVSAYATVVTKDPYDDALIVPTQP